MFKSASEAIQQHQSLRNSLRNWLYTLPCVLERRVVIDVRGAYPVAIVNLRAQEITNRDEFFYFVAEAL